MNSFNPIGGYFELELEKNSFLYAESILLNSGRSCFEYILIASKVTHAYLPKFICSAMLEPLKRLNIQYSFYTINEDLEIESEIELKSDEILVYVNYAGVKDEYCNQLSDKYRNQLVLDCSQAFYFKPRRNSHTFYSPRKFFGVADGGCLYTDIELNKEISSDTSYRRSAHLLKRIDLGAEQAYEDFQSSEKDLVNAPIKRMSRLTKRILESIDYKFINQKRYENFLLVHDKLKKKNRLVIDDSTFACPMYYPLLMTNDALRETLISNKIFVATYWPNVLEWCEEEETEYQLAKNLVPLPIDQRYNKEDMSRIIEIVDNI